MSDTEMHDVYAAEKRRTEDGEGLICEKCGAEVYARRSHPKFNAPTHDRECLQ